MKGHLSFRRGSLLCLALAVAWATAGCGKVEVDGVYQDARRPEVVYDFRPDATWVATMEMKVPVGLLPYGSGRRLEGVYELKGRRLELRCRAVYERDPVSGEFRPVRIFDGDDETLLRGYDHVLVVVDGTLRSAEGDAEEYPFGAVELAVVEEVPPQ